MNVRKHIHLCQKNYGYKIKDVEYYGCTEIENSLFFTLDTIRSCGVGYNNTEFYWKKQYNGELIDEKTIAAKRNKWRKLFQKAEMPEQCKNCVYITKKNWSYNEQIQLIVVAHRTKCSCNCIYCNFSYNKDYWNSRQSYNIMPVILDLEKKGLLSKDLQISICGGECTEYPNNELEQIAEFALKNKVWLSIYSSGINYSSIIAKCLKAGICELVISVDAGTQELYEKIKRVKKFDNVWTNIENYTKVAVSHDGIYGITTVKYVIIPGVNNTQKHFFDFIKKCREKGVTSIRIAIEYNWWNNNKEKPLPPRLIKLVKYIQKFNKEFTIIPTEFAILIFRIINENINTETQV